MAAWMSRELNLLHIAQSCNVHVGAKPILRVMLEVFGKQRHQARESGTYNHLRTVEMPWLKSIADMHYFGVDIDSEAHTALTEHASKDLRAVGRKLLEYGICDPESRENVFSVMCRNNLDGLFRLSAESSGYSLSDDLLKAHQKRHPLIQLLRRYRKVRNLLSVQKAVARALSRKGKVHPWHIPLGTETGRQTCTNPNLLGFDKILRNTVVPDADYAIAELDYSQQEVGIAAGLYQDEALIELFNTGDVYTLIAQRFYTGTNEIEPGAEKLPWEEFRHLYPHLRDTMKTVTLAVFYGQSEYGLARSMDIAEKRAAWLLGSFFELFPCLHQGLQEASRTALMHRYVRLVNDVSIYLDADPAIPASTTARLARNYPIQAMGAVIFKTAGVQLREVFAKHDARLLVPMHDAFIFQAPVGEIDEVVNKASEVMKTAMQEYFPKLEPRINVNTEDSRRWTKDSHPAALQDYLITEPGSLQLFI